MATKPMENLGVENRELLLEIQDQLKLALRDYKEVHTVFAADSENTYAKEEVLRLRLHIHTLAQNQKLILREIRRKGAETANSEPAKPKEHKPLVIAQVEPNNGAADISICSKEKENEANKEPKATNQPVKDSTDSDPTIVIKRELLENAEPEGGKCLNPVPPLGERPKHVDNMLPNNETANSKQPSASASTTVKVENENDADGAVWFLGVLELMPTCNLQQELRTTERKRATRQKRSTANHSQFVYDDSWDQDDKKKRKKEKETPPLKANKTVPLAVKAASTTATATTTSTATAPLRVKPPSTATTADATRPLNRKREMLLARQQLGELEKKNGSPKASTSAANMSEASQQRKNAPHSIMRTPKQKTPKLILPKPESAAKTDGPITVNLESNEETDDDDDHIPCKLRKVDPKKKRATPQKSPIDFSLERLSRPGWNTSIGICPPRERDVKPTFAASINSLIQAHQVPAGLSLKIPGLPSSLTIERIPEKQRVCCMCRKPAVVTGLFGNGDQTEKISDALTSCKDCGMTYHLSCTRSASTSNEFHVCPHCFKRQSTNPVGDCTQAPAAQDQRSGKEVRTALIMEKIRLTSEKDSLDKKLLELGTDVTCTFTSGPKPYN